MKLLNTIWKNSLKVQNDCKLQLLPSTLYNTIFYSYDQDGSCLNVSDEIKEEAKKWLDLPYLYVHIIIINKYNLQETLAAKYFC